MLFNSYIFLLAFLPIVWCIYFGLNKYRLYRSAQAALILASFIFYGYQDWWLCLLLTASILINYILHCMLVAAGEYGASMRRVVLAAGLAVNFSLLLYFKYLNFTLENLNFLLGKDFPLQNIILPLGISFYTFQQVSFLVDSYRGEMGRYRLLDYGLFVSFFPQLVAGPIVRHQEMIPQFGDPEKKKIQYANMTSGMEYLIFGLAKKVLLADTFARLADAGFGGIRQLNALSAVAVMLAYTLEIYFDFSGYCDMAIGLGKLFNIDIPINFQSPYKALNISDFWKRWHITLTRFLTSYLYIPLGGNRKGKWRTCLNVMVVFTLSGLWHGADWTFVLWGALHGSAMVLYRLNRERADRMPKWLQWAVTFAFVNFAWVFFRGETLLQPLKLFYMMFFGGGGGFTEELVGALCSKSGVYVVAGRFLHGGLQTALGQMTVLGWLGGGVLMCRLLPSTHELVRKHYRRDGYYLILSILLVWVVIRLADVSKFIYFNF